MKKRLIASALLLGTIAASASGQKIIDLPQHGQTPIDWPTTSQRELVRFAPAPRARPITFAYVSDGPIRRIMRGLSGAIWRWSAPRVWHYSAMQVWTPQAGGTGVCIAANNGRCLALTNHHVVEPYGRGATVRVVWANGQTAQARILGADPRLDLAAIEITGIPQGMKPVPIAASVPPTGTMVEIMGFGGPGKKLRHFEAPLMEYQYRVAVDTPVISGDSGSGIVYNGRLIGVNWGGSSRTPAPVQGVWDLVYPACSHAGPTELRQFVSQYAQQWCYPGGPCAPQPQQFMPQQGGADPNQYMYPPSQPVTPPPVEIAPPQIQPPQNQQGCDCDLDYDKIAAGIAKLINENPQWRGAKGEQGPPGPKGADAKLTQADLDIIAAKVSAMVMAQSDQLRGPPGPAPDINAITQQVLAQLPPMKLQLIGDGGAVIDEDTVPIGGTLRLQLQPIQR